MHPLIENKVDASKELAFGSRVSVMEKRGKQDRMSGNKNGNASVTFAQPKGTVIDYFILSRLFFVEIREE